MGICPSAARCRPRADDPMFVSRLMARGRETRPYNFGVFAYLFNSLFDLGLRLVRMFHDPTGRPSHLYFEIYLTTAMDMNASGPPCQWVRSLQPASRRCRRYPELIEGGHKSGLSGRFSTATPNIGHGQAPAADPHPACANCGDIVRRLVSLPTHLLSVDQRTSARRFLQTRWRQMGSAGDDRRTGRTRRGRCGSHRQHGRRTFGAEIWPHRRR
jgi:hypothetical protein